MAKTNDSESVSPFKIFLFEEKLLITNQVCFAFCCRWHY